jgi:hypothetical protein
LQAIKAATVNITKKRLTLMAPSAHLTTRFLGR